MPSIARLKRLAALEARLLRPAGRHAPKRVGFITEMRSQAKLKATEST
jgi:hypothetical protein